MANLPEKNITQVDEITSVPANSKLFVNANGEFRQATVNEVVKSSTVVTSAVENAINTAVEDGVNSHFKQTIGSPILLTDSADGTLIDFKAYGRSTQKQYSGKNIFDYSRIKTTSANGATLTNNNDGSITISGSSILSNAFNVYFDYSHEETVRLLKVGELKLDINGVETTPYLYIQLRSGSSAYLQLSSSDAVKTKTVTQAMLDDENVYLRVGFYGASTGVSIVAGTMKPMLYQSEDNTYEPYVGGTASPNPDYPQAINSVADGGYFDGELLQGYYQAATGNFVSSVSYISNKNKIPCKGNDEVKLLYKEVVAELGIYFWDKDGSNIGKKILTSVNEVSATAPTNATYFTFWVNKSGIEPSNAKKIVVTINGKYALIVKSKGKNLWEFGDQEFTTQKMVYVNLPAGTYTCSANITSSGTDYTAKSTFMFYAVDCTTLIGQFALDRNVRNGASATIPQKIGAIKMYAETIYSNSVNDTAIFKDIQLEFGNTMTDYEPYKETVTYIPLNEPLRSSLDGTVTDEVSFTECKREFTEVVLDGTNLTMTYANSNIAYLTLDNIGNSAICSHFAYNNNRNIGDNANANTYLASGEFAIRTSVHDRIYFKKSGLTTVAKWTEWLQANPITVQYELAEPITESIEPVDIVTYDNVTYLTASDNADMELEYPTSKVAGIASIGYSKGRKAEYEVELLKAQLLELQTAMVNSL